MCLYIAEGTLPSIAEEDIPVFKIAKYENDKIFSYYKSFVYEPGITYKTELGKPMYALLSPEEKIYEGFHSYTNDCKWGKIVCGGKYICIYGINDVVGLYDGSKVVKLNCVIPKGSTYYINPNLGACVSNQIKVINLEVIE